MRLSRLVLILLGYEYVPVLNLCVLDDDVVEGWSSTDSIEFVEYFATHKFNITVRVRLDFFVTGLKIYCRRLRYYLNLSSTRTDCGFRHKLWKVLISSRVTELRIRPFLRWKIWHVWIFPYFSVWLLVWSVVLI